MKKETNLKKWRMIMGYTQEELAEELHISASSYIKYENGQRNLSEEIKKALASMWDVQTTDLEKDIEGEINLFKIQQKSMVTLPESQKRITLDEFFQKEIVEYEDLAGEYLEYGVGDTEIWCESFRMILQHFGILMFQGDQMAEGTIILWDGEKFARGYNYYETFIDGGYVTDTENYQMINKEKVKEILKQKGNEFHTIHRVTLSVAIHSKKEVYQMLTN